ncbi:MAG: LiaI-LiaF-like domain-containing protein [Bacteroidales bacterium]
MDPGLGPIPPTWRKNVYGIGDDPRRKSPALAFILSGMPGLGQVYVGYYQQGFAHVLVATTLILLLASRSIHALAPAFGFFLAFFWLYNMIDAFRRASFYNQALAGFANVQLPPDIGLPKGQGSLIGGIALIAVGGLVLANTAFGMSLDWLEQWWPASLVLLGAYLVYASFAARRKAAEAAAQEPRG